MPELPEVQTVVNGIKSKIINLKVLRFQKYTNKLRYPIQRDLASQIEGHNVTMIFRRAKYIIINLSNNKSIILHLGMSGRILIECSKKKIKHTHFCIFFNKNLVLQFIDPRRFGYIFLNKTDTIADHKFFKNLGVEPLSKKFNAPFLIKLVSHKHTSIKNIIMNQKYVAGIGNIYASEALFVSGINPAKLGSSLLEKDCANLIRAIKVILRKSIKLGGSSINDYTMISGKMGYFQNKLKVYGRAGFKCIKKSCQSSILRIEIAQRSTFYCPKCQK